MRTFHPGLMLLMALSLWLVACGPNQEEFNATATQIWANSSGTQTAVAPTPTSIPTNTATATTTHTPTATLTATPTPSPTATSIATPTPKPSSTPAPTLTNTPQPGTGTWSRYQQRTLAELVELSDDSIGEGVEDSPTIYVETSEEYQYPSLVRVSYSGEFREVDPARKFIIERWANLFPSETAQGIVEAFQHEVLVTEGDVEYWLPIQEVLIPFMEDEVKAGGEMDVFIIFIGGSVSAQEGTDRVFLLNEFRVVTP